MRHRILNLGALFSIVLGTVAGCGGDDPGTDPVFNQSDALVGGTVTTARPEIGSFSRGCSATLIAPRYVLTAGHCSGYSTTVNPGDSVTFTDAGGVRRTYSVDRIHSFGALPGGEGGAFELTPDNIASGEGTNDVELLRLSTAVPATVANPARIAAAPPNSGDRVTVFGHGCTDRRTGAGGGAKQFFSYNFGSTSTALCPGDSGGPVVFGNVNDAGQIWGVNTGYWGSGADVHGNVTYFKNQIVRVMQSWEGTDFEVGIDRGGSDYRSFPLTTASPALCRSACIADSACRAYTYVAPGAQGPQARCWLKNDVPDWSPCPSCTSGTILAQEGGIDRPGSDYASFDLGAPRAELCAAACARDTGCQAYTYVAPGVQGPLARCWLKSGVPGAQSNGATVSGVRRGFESNVDRGGRDYSSFAVASADPRVCRDACSRDFRCKAFSYVAPGLQGPSAMCWLKSAAPAPTSQAGVTSGMKRGLEVNTDRGGMDYRSFDQTSAVPEVCQAACAAEAACQSWTFVPAGGQGSRARCWLKSGIPTKTTAEGLVSGLKGAEFF